MSPVIPARELSAVIEGVRLRAEHALLVMLDAGFGYADPRLPAETFLRTEEARRRVHRPGLKPRGTHAEAAAQIVELLAQRSEDADRSPALSALAERFRLARTEEAVVAVACAYELDLDVRSLCHALGGRRAPGLYVDHCLELAAGEIDAMALAAALSPASSLRLLVSGEPPDGRLALLPSTRQWLVGDRRIAPPLGPWVEVEDEPRATASHDAALSSRLDAVAESVRRDRGALVVVQGPPGSGKAEVAEALACRLGLPLWRSSLAQLARAGLDEVVSLTQLSQRARLFGAVVYVAGIDPSSDITARLLAVHGEGEGLLVLGTRQAGSLRMGPAAFHAISLDRAGLETRNRAWERELEDIASPADARDLARRYVVGPSDIRAACREAQRFAALDQRKAQRSDVEGALARQLQLDLGSFATRIARRALWDEMILPEDARETLRHMITMVRERSQILEDWGYARHLGISRGVSALFSGAPGTGKTMAASVISGELGLELFRIDLSQVVSKWVGETEKHLARIFDEAQNSHAMLLFDEADSLFGKRTEVKSASDRYANLEVNYILQRMEQFDGVSVLTTNLEAGIEPAFMRRLNFRVRFPEPDALERRKLWSTLLPPETGLRDAAELDTLASRFEMTGGHIRNAIVRAAVVAVQNGRGLSAADLESGALAEYYELGKVMQGI